MKLGIVGHAADKFTTRLEFQACWKINNYLTDERAHVSPCVLVSGRSPLGGVDVWAEEIALKLGVPTEIYPPTSRRWGGRGGYRDRNLAIAKASDLVVVFVVQDYPPTYVGQRFEGCYHCKGRNPRHVKSGGCWTAWRASPHCVWEILR